MYTLLKNSSNDNVFCFYLVKCYYIKTNPPALEMHELTLCHNIVQKFFKTDT